jgi:hypothetical protein
VRSVALPDGDADGIESMIPMNAGLRPEECLTVRRQLVRAAVPLRSVRPPEMTPATDLALARFNTNDSALRR